MCGFIAQLVEQRTGNEEVTSSNPVEVLIFFRLLLSNCLNWKIHCDDHSSLPFLFVQEFDKGKALEENMEKSALERKRCEELFYRRMPKAIADKLRLGGKAVEICEV